MNTELWFQVIKLLKGQPDVEALQDVMRVLLTREEQEAIGLRLAIMRALLSEEESQREIARRLGVSITKITRCSNYLKTLSGTEMAMIEQSK